MSIAQRKDGRWIVRYKDADGKWQQKSFRNESIARVWEADNLSTQAQAEERLTLGELTMLYFRSRPDLHIITKRKIVYFLAGYDKGNIHHPGIGEFLRDKYADSLNRQDLERMREG